MNDLDEQAGVCNFPRSPGFYDSHLLPARPLWDRAPKDTSVPCRPLPFARHLYCHKDCHLSFLLYQPRSRLLKAPRRWSLSGKLLGVGLLVPPR